MQFSFLVYLGCASFSIFTAEEDVVVILQGVSTALGMLIRFTLIEEGGMSWRSFFGLSFCFC